MKVYGFAVLGFLGCLAADAVADVRLSLLVDGNSYDLDETAEITVDEGTPLVMQHEFITRSGFYSTDGSSFEGYYPARVDFASHTWELGVTSNFGASNISTNEYWLINTNGDYAPRRRPVRNARSHAYTGSGRHTLVTSVQYDEFDSTRFSIVDPPRLDLQASGSVIINVRNLAPSLDSLTAPAGVGLFNRDQTPFSVTYSDPGGSPVFVFWDLDNDGRDDFFGDQPVINFAQLGFAPGERVGTVRLRDDFGGLTERFFSYTLFEPGPTPGDLDQSGTIDQGDLDLVLLNWGGPRGDWANAGGFSSGGVDQEELDAVLLNWGNTSPDSAFSGSPIPEPAAATLVFAGTALLHRRRVA